MTYGNDDDMKSILQFFSAFITKPNFINSNLNSEFITRKMIDIENMNNKLYSSYFIKIYTRDVLYVKFDYSRRDL
jgi:hypothetical protein